MGTLANLEDVPQPTHLKKFPGDSGKSTVQAQFGHFKTRLETTTFERGNDISCTRHRFWYNLYIIIRNT